MLKKTFPFFLFIYLAGFLTFFTFFSLLNPISKPTAASSFTYHDFYLSDYDYDATNVTYTLEVTTPTQLVGSENDYIYFIIRTDQPQRTGQADFTNASVTSIVSGEETITDDFDFDASVDLLQDGTPEGFYLRLNNGTLAAQTRLVIKIAGVTNTNSNTDYVYPEVGDSNGVIGNTGPLQHLGSPLLRVRVVDPSGNGVEYADVFIHTQDFQKTQGQSTNSAGYANFFADWFWLPDEISIYDDYTAEVIAPVDCDYSNANSFNITLVEGQTLDYTASGEGPVVLTVPYLKGTMVVPSGCETCTAEAGSAISDVDIDIRDESFNPNNFSHTRTNENGAFKIGGMGGDADGISYVVEFRQPYDMSSYRGLIPPATIDGGKLLVTDSDEDGVVDTVKYDGTTKTIAQLPFDLGNFPFGLATKIISGTVIKADSTPVSGARISAFKMMEPSMVDTTTNPDGEFTIYVGGGTWMFMPEVDQSSFFDDNAENDSASSWVYCGMPKSASFAADTSSESSANNTFTVYEADATITGLLKNPNGDPASNSGVNVFSKDGCGAPAMMDHITGRFTATVPAGTYNVNAQSWDNNYAPPAAKTVTVKTGQTTDIGIMTMSTYDGEITGRVWSDTNGNSQYDSGEGVGNVRVEAFKMSKHFDEFAGGPGGPMGGGGFVAGQSSNETATKGEFSLSVNRGTWILNVMADPAMMGGYSETSTNYVYTGSPREIYLQTNTSNSSNNNFEVKVADATINGRVVDASTNEGVSGVWGFAFAEPANTFNQGPMMGAGTGGPINNSAFTIRVPAGEYKIGVDFPPEASGYTPTGNFATVTATSGQTTSVDVPVLPNNAYVRVRFKDAQGNLVTTLSSAEVFLENGSGGHQWRMFSSQDLTNGYTDIPVSAGTWNIGYHIDPAENNYMSEPTNNEKAVAVAEQTVTKDITLYEANSTLAGVVNNPSGDPLSGVWINVDSRKSSDFDKNRDRMFMFGKKTDSDGQYSLNLPAGDYKVEAFFPPSATVDGQDVNYLNPEPKQLTLSANQTSQANFNFKESTASITGSITLDGSTQGAFVSAYSANGGYNETVSTDGSYSLNVTTDDTWYARAIYESGSSLYFSDIYEVSTQGTSSATQNLVLEQAAFTIPDPVTTTFNCANAKKITLSNGAELSIPANAIKPSDVTSCDSTSSDSNITISIAPTVQMSLQDKSIPVGVGYEITATDTSGREITDTFSSNVTLKIPYTDAQIEALLGSAVDESFLTNGYWDTSISSWRNVANQTIDTDANMLTISVNHFTLFGVLATSDPSTTNNSGSTNNNSSSSTSSSSGGTDSPPCTVESGATIHDSNNIVSLIVPDHAVEWDAKFDLDLIDTGYNNPIPPMWIGSGPIKVTMRSWFNSAVFTDFLKPTTLIMHYDPAALGQIPEKTLKVYYYDEANQWWRPLKSFLLADRNEVATIIEKNYGIYALIGGYGSINCSSYTWCGVGTQLTQTVADSSTIGIPNQSSEPEESSEVATGEAELQPTTQVEEVGSEQVQQEANDTKLGLLMRVWQWVKSKF